VPRPASKCFSFINFYPDFKAWDYTVTSQKNEEGWIYLRDVTKNGLGIHTRFRLPYGTALSPFPISVTTPGLYTANGAYTLVRYNYRTGQFGTTNLTASGSGSITITSPGGMGEEIGISGSGLQPAVTVLIDTLNESIYLRDNVETALSFDAVNLSETDLFNVNFTVHSGNSHITVLSGTKTVNLPAKSKVRLDSLALVRAAYIEDTLPQYFNDVGYIKINTTINSIPQDREQHFQIRIQKDMTFIDSTDAMIFDGRSEDVVDVLTFGYTGVDEAVRQLSFTEGTGNGNGMADSGEVVSLWIRLPQGLAEIDQNTWHPTIPLIGQGNSDIRIVGFKEHEFCRGRPATSAQFLLKRTPTRQNPIVVPVFTQLVAEEYQEGADYGSVDAFVYSYHTVILPLGANIGIEQVPVLSDPHLSLTMKPNPFNPAVSIQLRWKKRPADLSAQILDPLGRKILDLSVPKGRSGGRIVWDGIGRSGKKVGAGLYLLRVKWDNRRIIRKLLYTP
jgi:hypothetical protein